MTQPLKPLAALLLLPIVSEAAPQEDYAATYGILKQANLALDAGLAKEKGSWRFAEDRGILATATDFDKLQPADLGD
jgi:hypothetical protein